MDIKSYFRESSTASFRYLPTLLKVFVFYILDSNGHYTLTGEYGLVFAEISFISFLIGMDITSILHKKYLNGNLNISELFRFQFYSVFIGPLIILFTLSSFSVTKWIISCAIISELLAQEFYRNSMIFVSLKKYTTIYVIKNSLPVLLLFLLRNIEFSIIIANTVTIIFAVVIQKSHYSNFNRNISISNRLAANIIRDSLFNLPNSFFLRSLELGARLLMGTSNKAQSYMNYLILIGNGINSIYDVFVVNLKYKDWMNGKFKFKIPKILQLSIISAVLFLLFLNLDYLSLLTVYSFTMISSHSNMMNNLADSKTSLLLVAMLAGTFLVVKSNNFFIWMIPSIIFLYSFLNLRKYEIPHKDSFHFKI